MFFKRFLRKITLALSLLSVMSAVQATEGDKPEEIILGITTFLSGSASVFGVPGKVAAEIYLEELNAGAVSTEYLSGRSLLMKAKEPAACCRTIAVWSRPKKLT